MKGYLKILIGRQLMLQQSNRIVVDKVTIYHWREIAMQCLDKKGGKNTVKLIILVCVMIIVLIISLQSYTFQQSRVVQPYNSSQTRAGRVVTNIDELETTSFELGETAVLKVQLMSVISINKINTTYKVIGLGINHKIEQNLNISANYAINLPEIEVPIKLNVIGAFIYELIIVSTVPGLEYTNLQLEITVIDKVSISITRQPQAMSNIELGDTFGLSVEAQATHGDREVVLSYLWFSSINGSATGVPIQNANSSTYVVPSNQVGKYWYYVQVMIANDEEVVAISEIATVNISRSSLGDGDNSGDNDTVLEIGNGNDNSTGLDYFGDNALLISLVAGGALVAVILVVVLIKVKGQVS